MPHLITGRDKVNHVTSANDGLIHARMYGSGRYALHDAACSMETANIARVTGGLLLMDGRFVEIDGAGEEVAIANGSQGQKRNDLVGVRYTVDADGYESATFEAIKGVPTDGVPEDPPYDKEASILRGDADVFWPLFRVKLDGLSVGTPESLVGGWGLSIGSGGTGATTGKAACKNIGAFAMQLGAISDMSPAALYNLAPGSYIVPQTAANSPCPGVYGNIVVSRNAGNRTFAVVAFDNRESYILRGCTNATAVASWDRIDGGYKVLSTASNTYMHGGQVVHLSDKVSNQPTGIVIVWSYINDSTQKAENQHFVYQFVPKSHVENYDGCSVTLQVTTGTAFNFIAQKYVFVSDSTITGYAANAENGTRNGVTYNNRALSIRGVLGV